MKSDGASRLVSTFSANALANYAHGDGTKESEQRENSDDKNATEDNDEEEKTIRAGTVAAPQHPQIPHSLGRLWTESSELQEELLANINAMLRSKVGTVRLAAASAVVGLAKVRHKPMHKV